MGYGYQWMKHLIFSCNIHTDIHSSTVSSLFNTGTQVFHVTDHEVKSMTGPLLGKREVGTRWGEQNGR